MADALQAVAPAPRTITSAVLRTAAFHGRAGGLWYDRLDADDVLDAAASQARIDATDADVVRSLMTNGFAVVPGAVPPELTTELVAAVDAAVRAGDGRFLGTVHGHEGARPCPVEPWMADRPSLKVLDSYVHLPVARDVLLAPAIRRILRHVFDGEAPVLFQSLQFLRGSEQWLHRDTAYVKVARPMELVGCWIALQDVQPGSGELAYVPGSHRLGDMLLLDRFKSWSPDFGQDVHQAWLEDLHRTCDEQGLTVQRFRPERGDALFWHADLVHGGVAIEQPDATRHSTVGHYCPASTAPLYVSMPPDRRAAFHDAWYSSDHHDVGHA